VLRVLRHRDFTLLWCAGLVSVAGDWMLLTALPFYVYVETGSTLATAGMTMAELVPGIVLSSFTGVVADRHDRGRILLAAYGVQALVASTLVVVARGGPVGLVYVVALAQSAAAAFAAPAESALLPDLVDHDELVAANAMNALNNRLGRLAGIPLGAVLLAGPGLGAVVVVDAATFAVASVLVGLQRSTSRPARQEDPGRLGAAWLAGLRAVGADRGIALLFVVLGLMTLAGTMLDPLAAPWVRTVLDGGPQTYALLLTVASVAGIAGSVLVGTLGPRLSAQRLIGWASVVGGVVTLVRVNVPHLVVAAVLTAVSGVLGAASAVAVETLAQQRVPAALRGRVFGSLQATIWLMSLVGAALGGVLGETVGIVVGLDVAAVLLVLAGAVALVPALNDARRPRPPRGVEQRARR
jgi:MFS family permease